MTSELLAESQQAGKVERSYNGVSRSDAAHDAILAILVAKERGGTLPEGQQLPPSHLEACELARKIAGKRLGAERIGEIRRWRNGVHHAKTSETPTTSPPANSQSQVDAFTQAILHAAQDDPIVNSILRIVIAAERIPSAPNISINDNKGLSLLLGIPVPEVENAKKRYFRLLGKIANEHLD
jgi:hypothetical protein